MTSASQQCSAVPGPSLDAGKARCRVKNLTNTIHSACVRSRDLHEQRLHSLIFDFSSPISSTFPNSPASDSPLVQHSSSTCLAQYPVHRLTRRQLPLASTSHRHRSFSQWCQKTGNLELEAGWPFPALVGPRIALRTLIAWGSSIQKQPTAPPNAIAAIPHLRPQVLATTKQLDVLALDLASTEPLRSSVTLQT